MTRNAQDIIDDMRNIVKPRIAKMLLEANFEGCGKEDKAEFETEFEMILTLAEIGLKFLQISNNATNGDVIKALFYVKNVEEMECCTFVSIAGDADMRVYKEWWNAPYAESEESE